MKKSLSYILLLTMSIVALGACGNKETASPQNPDNSPHNAATTKFAKAKEVGIYQAIHNNKNPMIWYRVEGNPSKDAYPTIYIFKDNKVLHVPSSDITLGDIANLNTTNPKKILEYINPQKKIKEDIQELVEKQITSIKGTMKSNQDWLDSIAPDDSTYPKDWISKSEQQIEWYRQDILALEKFDTKLFYDYYPVTFSIKTSDSGNNTIEENIEYTEISFTDEHNSEYEEHVKRESGNETKYYPAIPSINNSPLFIDGYKDKKKLKLTGQPTVPFQIYDSEFTGFYTGNGDLFITLFDGKTKYTFDSPKTKGIQVD